MAWANRLPKQQSLPVLVLNSSTNSLRSEKVLSVQKELFPCPIGLHESWVPQAAKFKRVVVSVAFMTMRNELLLKQDASGKFVLPSEHFPASDLLLSAPLRVLIQPPPRNAGRPPRTQDKSAGMAV
jgi:hypothetical protein